MTGLPHYRVSAFRMMPLLLILLLLPLRSGAHAVGQSYLFLSIFSDSVEGYVEVPVSDLNRALGLDFKTDKSVTLEDVDLHAETIKTYITSKVKLAPDGAPGILRATGHRMLSLSFAQFVIVDFVVDELAGPPETIDVDFAIIEDFESAHRSMLVIENNWRTSTFNNEGNVSLTFTAEDHRQQLNLSSSSLWRGFLGMVEIGTHHIAIGLDHILFILALLVPSVMERNKQKWMPVRTFRTAFFNVVKVVTVFTIAHSITLSLATLNIVQMPSRLVESIIALSIILVALDIIIPVFKKRIWLVVFIFGLFHGFGFASVLSEMGIHSNYVALTLLGFNVGVEAGQLAIVLVAFPLFFLLRSTNLYARIGMPYGASALIVIAAYWFIERAFEIDLPAGALVNQARELFS